MKGKLIVIEGTENSGKETQANLLVERLNASGIKSCKMRFPMYDTPTGEIIHDHVLNKNDEPYFEDIETPKAVSLYYAADAIHHKESHSDDSVWKAKYDELEKRYDQLLSILGGGMKQANVG